LLAGHGNKGRTFLSSVILTKVRIQVTGGGVAWLWILTFVRMTGVFGGAPFSCVGGGAKIFGGVVGVFGPPLSRGDRRPRR